MLFMGEEWGADTPWQFFTSHPEPELAEATAKGRTEEFARMGWDESLVPHPNDPATFERSKLDWSEIDPGADNAGPHLRLLQLYRDLARLRRERPELTDPAFGALTAEAVDIAGGRRFRLGRGALTVLVNLSGEPWHASTGQDDTVLLATDADAFTAVPAAGVVTVAPETAVVVGPSLR